MDSLIAPFRESSEPQRQVRGFRHLRVLVVGLGRFGGGVGVSRWLAAQGARVTVTDQADAKALAESLSAIGDCEIEIHLGGHDIWDLDSCDLVVLNPAVVKARSTFFQEIVRRGIPWTTEINLFCERCPAPVVGVTGTFGKSTTSAMIAAALETCCTSSMATFSAVHFGGNIGVSLLPNLERIKATDVVVLEMSNAQLEDLPKINWSPRWAVITNLVPHHLDRYDGSIEAYFEAKLNIVGDGSQPGGVCRPDGLVLGEIHPLALERLAARWPVESDRTLRFSSAPFDLELKVPGGHNRLNAACAMALCRMAGAPEQPVRTALATFNGLAHRLEFVRRVKGVDFYNDSKSTAPSATEVALRSFDRPVVAILGGQRKEGVAFDALSQLIHERCRAAVCVGAAGPQFAGALRNAASIFPGSGSLRGAKVSEAMDLAEGIARAQSEALDGDVVLLSPGAPSFDAYNNYVQRGEHFVALVNAL